MKRVAGYRLYEELIEGIPPGIRVLEAVCGASHTAVRAESGTGVAMSLDLQTRPSVLADTLAEIPAKTVSLRDLAAAVLSWNFRDASVGAAALNAWYNTEEAAARSFPGQYPAHPALSKDNARTGPDPARSDPAQSDPFLRYRDLASGKKVVSIGRFAPLERTLAPVCELSVIEQTPLAGDYPEAAAEYLLGESDIVFITGCTLANKTLPRLLELCAGAFVVLAGPSVTLAPVLFGRGVSVLAGSIFSDPAECLSTAAGGDHKKMVKSGMKVLFESDRHKKGTSI